MKILKSIDWLIVLPIIVIFSLSLLIIFSINAKFTSSQLIFLLIGLVGYFVFANLDYRILEKFPLFLYLISLFLLLLTFIIGRVTRGSIRWIEIGALNFQSSEFIKPLLILSFSAWVIQLNLTKMKNLFTLVFICLVPVLLVFKQPDLGNSLVILAIWLGIIFAAGIPIKYMLLWLAVFILGFPFAWHWLKPYQQQRIVTFLNPNFDPLGSGYNLLQSIITVGSGEFLGRGLGKGTQSQLRFLPEHHTDFIFSSFSEELGFLGASILMMAYLIMLARILVIAKNTPDNFGRLVCLGVFMMIFFQLLVNVGMNLGIFPITGVTLPLFSAGGSSLITVLISLGIVQNISTFLQRKAVIEIK